MRGPLRPILAALAVLLVVGACGGPSGDPELEVIDASADSYEYDYVIPEGTGVRIDKGEDVEIVPQVLDVKVGERIRIENDDVRGAQVGIFWVPAGRTVAMQFTTPGSLSGECDVHPSGEFTVNVEPV